jgi:hypothetical protein
VRILFLIRLAALTSCPSLGLWDYLGHSHSPQDRPAYSPHPRHRLLLADLRQGHLGLRQRVWPVSRHAPPWKPILARLFNQRHRPAMLAPLLHLSHRPGAQPVPHDRTHLWVGLRPSLPPGCKEVSVASPNPFRSRTRGVSSSRTVVLMLHDCLASGASWHVDFCSDFSKRLACRSTPS